VKLAHVILAVSLAGCISSLETRTQLLGARDLPPLKAREPGEVSTATMLHAIDDDAAIDVELASVRPCVLTTFARSQRIERRTYIAHGAPGALVVGLLATAVGGAFTTAAIADGKTDTLRIILPLSIPLGLFGVVTSSQGVYHTVRDGTTEVAYGRIDTGQRLASEPRPSDICESQPLADVALQLWLREAAGGRVRAASLGTTDHDGLVRVDLRTVLARAFPGWPFIEVELERKASIVFLTEARTVVGEIDLSRYPAARFDEHLRHARR
jgi:hypothetical protein